jgi:hypothetical protein
MIETIYIKIDDYGVNLKHDWVTVLIFYTEYGSHKVIIKDLEEEGKIDELIYYLKERLNVGIDKKINYKLS